ncbi:MAG: Radical domain protein [Frankiales bacterium]|jgi:organic radical activating enzyme|nr:Radical domain protein [Frankiales bacterium]
MCNLACSWCDTAYTWDRTRYDLSQELRSQSRADVVADILGRGSRLVVVTGGEPLLQAEALTPVIEALRDQGRTVEMETSGTVDPAGAASIIDLFVVSPKLANSGQPLASRIRWQVLEAFAAGLPSVFKFVVTGPDDLNEVDGIAARLGLAPERVWIMPEGTSPERIISTSRRVAEPVAGRGWSLSGRLHITLWSDARGR